MLLAVVVEIAVVLGNVEVPVAIDACVENVEKA